MQMPAAPKLFGEGESILSFDRQFDVHRALFFAESAAQLRERNVLQLPDALTSDAEFFANFFESLWFSAVQPEALEDNFTFPVIQHFKKLANFITQVFVS